MYSQLSWQNQLRLIELLAEATEVSVRWAPGFVSASLHRSKDGTKVTMSARWRSIDHYQAMRQDSRPIPLLQEALTIAIGGSGRSPERAQTIVTNLYRIKEAGKKIKLH